VGHLLPNDGYYAQLYKIAHFFDEMGDFCILGVFFILQKRMLFFEIVKMQQSFVKMQRR